MEISQLQSRELNRAGLRGDCGGLRRAEQGERRASSALLLKAHWAPRQPLYPRRAASPRPSDSGPAPPYIPGGLRRRGKGGALSSGPANERLQKEAQQQANLRVVRRHGGGVSARRGRWSERWVTWLATGGASAFSQAKA